AVHKEMRQYGSPDTATVPIDGTQQDAEEHPGQEPLELHMKGGEEDSGGNDAGPGIPENMDHDALQGPAKTEFFKYGRQQGYHENIDKDIDGRIDAEKGADLFVG